MIHPKLKPLLLALLVSFVVYTPFFATTIVPFDNYAEMAKASKNVVLAKVVKVFKETIENNTYDVFEFIVENTVKGNLKVDAHFKIKTFGHTTQKGLRFVVADDLFFVVERSYFLSLADLNNGFMQPKLLNYAVLEEIKLNNTAYLVPTSNSRNVSLMPTFSGKVPEQLIQVDKEKFINYLKLSINNSRTWNIFESKTDKHIISETRAEPTGCSYFFRNITASPQIAGVRWNNILTQPIYLWKEISGDASLTPSSTVFGYVNTALNILMQQYPVKFTDGGNVAYNPVCNNANSLTDFLESQNIANVALDRRAIIYFNDTCNELDDLSSGGGTLALGGVYYCSSDISEGNIFNGEFWLNACFGSVTVNNGVGAYFNNINSTTSSTNYTRMLTHELGHVLGIGHITPAEGYLDNNMNHSCCNPISNKDRECFNYAYAVQSALPVELTHFEAKAKEETVDIEWHTEIEVNHNMYVLERSSNGKDFHTLYTIKGKGGENKGTDYNYTDLLPNIGINFYRLRMIDKNGKEELSKTISIDFKTSKMSLKIYPNPTEGGVNFHILSPNENVSLLEVFDVTGKLISNNKIDNALKDNTLSISTKDWSKGVYIVRLSNNAAVITQKLIKS